jgi:hypothetical protein
MPFYLRVDNAVIYPSSKRAVVNFLTIGAKCFDCRKNKHDNNYVIIIKKSPLSILGEELDQKYALVRISHNNHVHMPIPSSVSHYMPNQDVSNVENDLPNDEGAPTPDSLMPDSIPPASNSSSIPSSTQSLTRNLVFDAALGKIDPNIIIQSLIMF